MRRAEIMSESGVSDYQRRENIHEILRICASKSKQIQLAAKAQLRHSAKENRLGPLVPAMRQTGSTIGTSPSRQ
jgi:hypothetical protein